MDKTKENKADKKVIVDNDNQNPKSYNHSTKAEPYLQAKSYISPEKNSLISTDDSNQKSEQKSRFQNESNSKKQECVICNRFTTCRISSKDMVYEKSCGHYLHVNCKNAMLCSIDTYKNFTGCPYCAIRKVIFNN